MNSTVVYASRHGNTRRVAEAIADVLRSRGDVRLVSIEEAPAILPEDTDLLVVGGPTEGHGMTPPVARWLDWLGASGLRGVTAAAFDTRLRWPRWLSGSAAADIAERLGRFGARVLGPEGSFLVTMRGPELQPGELGRVAAWATRVAAAAESARAPARA